MKKMSCNEYVSDTNPVHPKWYSEPSVQRCALLLTAAVLWAQPLSKSVDVAPYLDRADKAQQQGDLQAAIKELREAIRLNPSSAEAHGRLGLVYRRLGAPAEAADSLE